MVVDELERWTLLSNENMLIITLFSPVHIGKYVNFKQPGNYLL